MRVKFYKNTALLLTIFSLSLMSCQKDSDTEISSTLTSVEITGSAFEAYNGTTVYVPFTVTPADYPLQQPDLFMGVYDSQVTKSTSTDYPPFTDEFSVYELIATDVAGEWLAGVYVSSGNFYADANIAIAIRQLNSSGVYEYIISSEANITTKPSLSADLIDIIPSASYVSLKSSTGDYQPVTFNIASAALSAGSSNYYDISNMYVIADSVMISTPGGTQDTLDYYNPMFSLERVDDMNWTLSPKSNLEDSIYDITKTTNYQAGYIRFMLADKLTADTISIVASTTYYPNELVQVDDIEWTLDDVKRYENIQIPLSSYLAKLGITQAMLDSNEDIEEVVSTLTFTKSDGDSIDDYCEYSIICKELEEDSEEVALPETLDIKFYNDLTDLGDYVATMNFEYGISGEESYIQATITLNIEVVD